MVFARASVFGTLVIALTLITGCSSVGNPPTIPEMGEPTADQPPGLQPCGVATERAVGETISSQIDALRAGDFDSAYQLAAPDFQAGVPLDAFEAIIRQGFSGLLEATSVTLSECLVDPSRSLAETTVTLRTTSQDVLTLRYTVTEITEGWRILGAEPVAAVSLGT